MLSQTQDTDGLPHPWLRHYDASVPAHIEYPRVPLYTLLDDTAAAQPNKAALLFYGRQFAFRDLKAHSDALASSLRRLGVQPGDRVALLLPNMPQFVVAYYGILKAGAAVVPLNPLYTEGELSVQITDAGAETVITIPMFLDKVGKLMGNTPLKRVIAARLADALPFPLSVAQRVREAGMLRRARGMVLLDFKTLADHPAPADFHPAPADPDDLAVLIYSGGTTGVAKGIMLSHYACVANAYQIAAWGNLRGDERMLAVLPLFHGFGMSVTMNAPILHGGTTILMPRFNAADVLKAIQKYRPTFFIGVPTMFVALSNLPDIGRYDLSSLEGIFVGAAPLTRAIKENFEAKTGARMIEGYGLTEAVTAIMANPYHGTHKIGSIGIPFPDVEVKIVGLNDGRDLPPGELGEIILRSPTLMLGYYKNEAETAKALMDGWLHTGDIGMMDEDGYFTITDRKKELIIVGGFNVFPREIDEVIYKHPKVKEGIAVGIPDEYKGERIKAYIVLKDGETATPEEFKSYFRENLTPYKVPSEVEFRPDLPKSMIGKIMRRTLREEEMGRT